MFGRIPRLFVDLVFWNVLHDDAICDYNSYLKSLVGDLSFAMLLAQRGTSAEQKHQRDQYKRAKGHTLSVGDQVLVENKGARGKWKLSDKWEPVKYMVVASKPALLGLIDP